MDTSQRGFASLDSPPSPAGPQGQGLRSDGPEHLPRRSVEALLPRQGAVYGPIRYVGGDSGWRRCQMWDRRPQPVRQERTRDATKEVAQAKRTEMHLDKQNIAVDTHRAASVYRNEL